jgi:hypothetical protein
MQRRIPDGIEERVSLRLTCRGYTAARWDVNAYRDRAPVEFLAVTASLLGPVILSTSLDVTISPVRHGSGQALQVARPQSTEHVSGLLLGVGA